MTDERDLTRRAFRELRQAPARAAPQPVEDNMDTRIDRPADPHSPDWALFYEQNPHLRRSVGAAGDDGADGGDDGGDGGGEAGGDGGDAGAGGEGGGEAGALPDGPDGYVNPGDKLASGSGRRT